MQRYFISDVNADGSFEVSGDDFFHIVKVMRQSERDKFYAVIEGRTAIAEIKEIADKTLVAVPVCWEETTSELPVDVTIVCGLPKGDKLDLIVQKGTELGAHSFVPFAAKRSVVKWDNKKSGKKIERLQKIAKEAAEQSHRNRIPCVEPVADLCQLLAISSDFDHKLVAFEEAARSGEKSNLAATFSSAKPGEKVMIVFGPEGGLDKSEVQKLEYAGFILCGLGPRILRAETAPLYVLSSLSFAIEHDFF